MTSNNEVLQALLLASAQSTEVSEAGATQTLHDFVIGALAYPHDEVQDAITKFTKDATKSRKEHGSLCRRVYQAGYQGMNVEGKGFKVLLDEASAWLKKCNLLPNGNTPSTPEQKVRNAMAKVISKAVKDGKSVKEAEVIYNEQIDEVEKRNTMLHGNAKRIIGELTERGYDIPTIHAIAALMLELTKPVKKVDAVAVAVTPIL